MEEIERVMMEVTSGGEESSDDFYEMIEAPKFVDLTAPDRRPEGDDRYWFCSRVGCDQKHEEEMDSEAIYRNFVLRVMAARSPSVRLRKVLCKKDSSSHLKCPNTVPAKPSRSRISRLAMISSIPLRAPDNARTKAGQIISKRKHSTPKAKAKGQESSSLVAVKALTTPRSKQKKCPLNPKTFHTVQNPRTKTVMVPKERGVAKALVFHSPKRTVKLKRSVELSASMKKICDGMRKLEIASKSNVMGPNHEPVPSYSSRKPLRGREVKSRVFDSLHTQRQKGDKFRSPGSLKKRVKGKEESKLCADPSIAHEVINHEARDMDVEKPSLCSRNGMSMSNKTSGYEELSVENKSEGMSEASKGEDSGSNVEESVPELKLEPSLEEPNDPSTKKNDAEKAKQHKATEIEDKENALALEGNEKEHSTAVDGNHRAVEDEGVESDDKENASASDNNRKVDHTADCFRKKKAFGKKETCKTTQKVAAIADKCLNGRIISAGTGAQGAKYAKPKPTNPKPFRLRTDERGILKEANLEKKQHPAPAKEETTTLLRNSRPKHQHTVRLQNGTSRSKATKLSSTKLLRANASNREESSERTKPIVRKQTAVFPGASSSRKKRTPMMTPTKRLEAIKETSPVILECKEVAKASKQEIYPAVQPSPFAASGRRPVTVPREPNFHSIHVPKSCTRRMASEV